LSSRLKLPYVMSSSRKWAERLFQTRGQANGHNSATAHSLI